MFQFPGLALNPYVFRVQYLHVTIRSATTAQACDCASQYELSKVGFPIRKSADQSSFAAPHGLSQRITSFIASQRQGIHRMLLRHLIVLMIDVRKLSKDCRTMIRKTIFACRIDPNKTSADGVRSPECRWVAASPNLFPLHNDKQRSLIVVPAKQQSAKPEFPGVIGGARRDRTDDLKLAKLPLSQLSYGPDQRPTAREAGGPGRI